MRIQRLILEQVGCFDHLEIPFREGRDPTKADIHLIVGANGTGKSTILMAMAQHFSRLPTGLEKRLLSSRSYSRIQLDNGSAAGVSFRHSDGQVLPPGTNSLTALMNPVDRTATLAFFENKEGTGPPYLVRNYRRLANEFQPYAAQYQDVRFSFMAVAYGGRRSVEGLSVDGIVEQKGAPLLDACVIPRPRQQNQAEPLLQWIANTKAKAAFAMQRADDHRYRRYSDAIGRIEEIISRITGRRFRFLLSDDPINVSAEIDGAEVPIDVLPNGLISLVSWIGDLLMRLDRVPWIDDRPILERDIILFLDEIEIHLHPAWQRQILPAVQDLFPNAQVFVSTHSPFIIASADDAWLYPLYLDDGGRGHLGKVLPSMVGNSYATVLRDVLGIEAEFAPQVDERLGEFYRLRNRVLGGESAALTELKAKGEELGRLGDEVLAIVRPEIRQVERQLTRVAESRSE